VIGAAFHLRLRGIELRGARIEISSSVPLGAGLSSSAALEIASLLAFKKLCDFSLPDLEIAKVGQAAEHSHAGVQCGLLDQISSLMSKPNKLTVIDCRTLQVSHVSMSPDLVFVIVNSGVKHALVAGEYNERRASCEQAARLLGVTALRDASADLLESKKDAMPQLVWKRARHVIEENDRVRTAIKAMNSDDFTALGRSMLESHESSKRNFQNSCPELDFLVETAAKQPGCLGARLSGGGFGGATINLVERSILGQFEAEIASTYLKKFHSKPLILHTTASSGAR
jgi:galactokinase